jgi:hypothetical protein
MIYQMKLRKAKKQARKIGLRMISFQAPEELIARFSKANAELH